MSRGSSYQDGIDDYPHSPSVSAVRPVTSSWPALHMNSIVLAGSFQRQHGSYYSVAKGHADLPPTGFQFTSPLLEHYVPGKGKPKPAATIRLLAIKVSS